MSPETLTSNAGSHPRASNKSRTVNNALAAKNAVSNVRKLLLEVADIFIGFRFDCSKLRKYIYI
jgi:hypothetical protein